MSERLIASLRIEANPHGDLLWIDYVHDDGAVYHSQALPAGVTCESAERMVNAINNPEAVFVVDNFPPIVREQIQRRIRLQ